MIQSYPWYIADWRNSETRLNLSLAARGLYRELLDYCYMEGSLPTERELLESIAGADGKQTRYCLDTVLKLFVLKEGANGNRYHHPKVDEVRDKLFSYHEQKRHAGVKSGQSRRDRALNGRSGDTGTGAEPSPKPAPAPTPSPSQAMPMPTPTPSQSEYPLTIAEIRKHDPAVDDFFVLRLVQETMQYCLSHKDFPTAMLDKLDDRIFMCAVRESYATGPPKHQPGLLLRRVPAIMVTEAKKGDKNV